MPAQEVSATNGGLGTRRARASASSGFARFLTFSVALHAVVVVAGITGGAAYLRSSGSEAQPAMIVFNSTPEPRTTESLVSAAAEPERAIDNPDPPKEPTDSPVSPEAEVQQTELSDFEPPASVASTAVRPTALDKVIGDPRSSWRLASLAEPGLRLGSDDPPVADCCKEPQPPPAVAVSAEVYVYPEVLSMARAEFPEKSQRLGEEGSVLLEMTVGPDGLVKEVKIAESSGYPRLDDCAVAAAWDWKFKPATRNGVPEAALARHRYTFRFTSSG
ncbi:MAG TPA: TonB family protein [Planctomycetota bacterium]|nr:TonB family protein [Planctomycetota bacterium]